MRSMSFIAILLWFSCTPVTRSVEETSLRSRVVNGIKTTVRVISPSTEALRAFKNEQNDSCGLSLEVLEDQYRRQLSFLINIAPDGERVEGDIMYRGVADEAAFKRQAYELNFLWEEAVELRCGNARYRPVLSTLENTYSLTHDRNVLVVFVPEHESDTIFYGSSDLDLIIDDQWFGTGVQHFKFKRSDVVS